MTPAELMTRLESHYGFKCEGGPLRNCVEWHQLRAHVSALQSAPPAGAQGETPATRYSLSGYCDGGQEASPSPDGDWVMAEDVDALESENAKLREALAWSVRWIDRLTLVYGNAYFEGRHIGELVEFAQQLSDVRKMAAVVAPPAKGQ